MLFHKLVIFAACRIFSVSMATCRQPPSCYLSGGRCATFCLGAHCLSRRPLALAALMRDPAEHPPFLEFLARDTECLEIAREWLRGLPTAKSQLTLADLCQQSHSDM